MGGTISKHPDDDDPHSPRQQVADERIKLSSSPSSSPMSSSSSSSSNPQQHQPQESAAAAASESKCPMHTGGSGGGYGFDITQLFRAAVIHGPKGTTPLSEQERTQAMAMTKKKNEKEEGGEENNDGSDSGGGGGGCPVLHNGDSSNRGNGNNNDSGGGCPVMMSSSTSTTASIDAANNMPTGPQTQIRQPDSNQQLELSTARVASTIPKGKDGTSTWVYPSPQQFYNALARKNKLNTTTNSTTNKDDHELGGERETAVEAEEEYMETVVALHNNMNEKTWKKVVEWEEQTYAKHATPKLLKFMGRPQDLSPKASLKHYLFQHPLPYDRHDWTVLRDNGDTVRYVIDYYYDESVAGLSEASATPALHDANGTPSLIVDVRPALDGPAQFWARAVVMPYQRYVTKQSSYEMLPLRGTTALTQQVPESVEVWKAIQEKNTPNTKNNNTNTASTSTSTTPSDEGGTMMTEEDAKQIAVKFSQALKDCSEAQKRMEGCTSEDEYAQASIDLTMCFGKLLCPVQHTSLLDILNNTNNSENDDTIGAQTEAALEQVNECVVMKSTERRRARDQYPQLFQK